MSQLYADLISKLHAYPETCYVPPARFKIAGPVVFQHLDAGDRGQVLLVLGSDGTIRVYPSDPRPMRPFTVTPAGDTTAEDDDVDATLESIPLPQPNSMWAYRRPGSDLAYALMYWRRIQPAMIASPLEPAVFTVNGHALPVNRPTSADWLSEVGEGWLCCIDEDLARGRESLTFSEDPDRKDAIQFTYQGLDYRLTEALSGPTRRPVPPAAGDLKVMAVVAAECVELRDRAVAVLVSAKAA
jgi:hypothetical protein